MIARCLEHAEKYAQIVGMEPEGSSFLYALS
jgi:hypothetical protein